MDRAELLRRLMATFLDELDEHVQTINHGLLTLEKEPHKDSSEVIKRLFRAAHSLKGASRAVDQLDIEQLCHHLEDMFSGLQTQTLAPSATLFRVMFSVADSIESAGMQLRAGEEVDASAMQALLPQLAAAAAGEPSDSATGTDAPKYSVESSAIHSTGSQTRRAEVLDQTNLSDSPDHADRRTISASIRVAEEKLDSLLAQAGELMVIRQRIEGRPDDVDSILEFVAVWKTEWQSVERSLRQLVNVSRSDVDFVPILRAEQRKSGDGFLRRRDRLRSINSGDNDNTSPMLSKPTVSDLKTSANSWNSSGAA